MRAAVVQLTTTRDVDASQDAAEALVRQAHEAGARVIALPENVAFMGSEKDKRALAQALSGPLFQRWSKVAQELGVTLLAGSNPEASEDPDRPYNSSVLFGPDGETLRARASENQCFVLAPAQYGENTALRRTYGRAMIFDPGGTVLARCPDRPSFALADIDLEQVRALRRKMPCLNHERHEAYRVG